MGRGEIPMRAVAAACPGYSLIYHIGGRAGHFCLMTAHSFPARHSPYSGIGESKWKKI